MLYIVFFAIEKSKTNTTTRPKRKETINQNTNKFYKNILTFQVPPTLQTLFQNPFLLLGRVVEAVALIHFPLRV